MTEHAHTDTEESDNSVVVSVSLTTWRSFSRREHLLDGVNGAKELADTQRQVIHIAAQHSHCGNVELISTGLDISTVKQVPAGKKMALVSSAMLKQIMSSLNK